MHFDGTLRPVFGQISMQFDLVLSSDMFSEDYQLAHNQCYM